MKFVCFKHQQELHWGFIRDNVLWSAGTFEAQRRESVNEIIRRVHENGMEEKATPTDATISDLLAPVPAPQKIVCIGRNYAAHAAEMASSVGELPVVFNKFPSAIAGPHDHIRLPKLSDAVDYEAELVVVIGRQARNVSCQQAAQHVFGYCCGNDVTARDWQKGRPGGQWLLGKSFDTFAPIGPWIVTRDQLDASSLQIQLRINGQQRQASNTDQLIFSIDYLISHISKFCTWHPGDLLFTGTPEGVGAGRHPPVFLQDGDLVEMEIQGIGKLANRVSACV